MGTTGKSRATVPFGVNKSDSHQHEQNWSTQRGNTLVVERLNVKTLISPGTLLPQSPPES